MGLMRYLLTGLLLAVILSGCGMEPLPHRITELSATDFPSTSPASDELDVVFLGTGGVYLRSADNAILGDPFFSNPPISDWVLLRPLQVREDIIDRYLPPLEQLQGILVAHVHHDHAMDIPYIASKAPPHVGVYGSNTLRNSLFSQIAPQRLIALNEMAAGQPDDGREQSGQWVYLNQQLRLLPVFSGHAPHLMGKVFNSDQITQPLAQVPQTVLDWQSGQALSFVIDFMEGDTPIFRVFYQSSAAEAPHGVPPAWLLQDGKAVDLALLGIANHGRLQNFPLGILEALQPKHVMILHWDRFWDEYTQSETLPAPGLKLAALADKLNSALPADVPVYLPGRGAHLRLKESP
ncbi:MAG: hypothetical protein GY938_15640 [Ketobacter sp.]|nr:hypothetical protein [Ketobacter sp.]